MATNDELAAAFLKTLSGSTELGQYDETLPDRLDAACEAGWALANQLGVTVPVTAATSEGPFAGHDTLGHALADQALAAYRGKSNTSKPRTLVQRAQQVAALVQAVAPALGGGSTPAPAPGPTPAPSGGLNPPAAPGAWWTGDYSALHNSRQVGLGNVQYQAVGGSIQNNGPVIPGATHPALGNCLKISLDGSHYRWEAEPPVVQQGGSHAMSEGFDGWLRFDFALGDNFKVSTSEWFNCIQQIHDSGTSSPPVEFDIRQNALWVRGCYQGGDTKYSKRLCDVAIGKAYKVQYHCKVSSSASKCLLEVWVNDQQVLAPFVPPTPNKLGGNSYWKGATLYCTKSLVPQTVFQANHRAGPTRESVG